MKPKLTGLLSTYHDLPLLQGRLDNLLTQDGVDFEVVVICEEKSEELDLIYEWRIRTVINTSEDLNAFDRWWGDDNIKIIETDGIPTLYDAWNQGIAIAEGGYITNINTDDRLYPGALQKMINVLDNNPDVGVVYPDVDRVDEIDGKPFGQYNWAEGDISVLLRGCFLGPMPMWRKSLHDEHGLFDPDMHSSGDYDFWLRLANAGVKFQRIPEVLGAYFDRPESIEHREPVRTTWETARSRGKYR